VNIETVPSSVPFPSVTVCNTGHLDMLVVDRIEKLFEGENSGHSDNSMNEFLEKYNDFHGKSTSFFQLYTDEMPERRQDMIEVSSRFGLVANVGQTLTSSAGIQSKDFIIHCQFMGKKCNVSQLFVKHFDPYFFNCFTFDPKVRHVVHWFAR
jgi:hypothetical protein